MTWRMRWMAAGAAAVMASGVGLAEVASSDPAPGGPAWSYSGSTGPSHWGELGFPACSGGRQQSPIDLTPARARALPDPRFGYGRARLSFTDIGESVLASPAPGATANTVLLDGARYTFAQVHVHTPSEHQVEGMHFPAEAHFVNRSASGSLAVVAVMLKGGGATNRTWRPVVQGVSQAAAHAGESAHKAATAPAAPESNMTPAPVTAKVDLAKLLPTDRRAYRYRGSLTTPPCTEGVSWTVLRSPVVLSDAQIAALTATHPGNNRPVQPREGRTVLLDARRG